MCVQILLLCQLFWSYSWSWTITICPIYFMVTLVLCSYKTPQKLRFVLVQPSVSCGHKSDASVYTSIRALGLSVHYSFTIYVWSYCCRIHLLSRSPAPFERCALLMYTTPTSWLSTAPFLIHIRSASRFSFEVSHRLRYGSTPSRSTFDACCNLQRFVGRQNNIYSPEGFNKK